MEEREGERGERGPASEGRIVVGIGVAAADIGALQRFFDHMPEDHDLAFVVAVQERRGHVIQVPQLLAGHTRMVVVEASDGMRVLPRQVHVAPPRAAIEISDRLLRVSRPERDFDPGAIDRFFCSLARDQRERAVGVLLAGSGSDGARGLGEIKAVCGMAMIQDHPSARRAVRTPHSAVTGAQVDYVLPVEECPRQLLEYVQGLSPRDAIGAIGLGDSGAAPLVDRVAELLRGYTGSDFSRYRSSSLQRRIERRMKIHRVGSPADYLDLLARRPAELDALFRELLIGVTSFFRDPDAFAALGDAFDRLLIDGATSGCVRAWVAGCATGEEAYSVAMLMRESVDRVRSGLAIRVLATDLDDEAIRVARGGLYPESAAADISPARLERFFDRHVHGYRVKRELRDLIVFAEHNLLVDPPFTRLDVICCRNVLIYLKPDAQDDVLYLMQHALRARGILFLGPQETLGPLADQFDPLDSQRRLFLRRELKPGRGGWRPAPVFRSPGRTQSSRQPPARIAGTQPLQTRLVTQTLLDELVPPCVLVNARGDIVHVHGRTGRFLEPAPGAPSVMRLHRMARPGLEWPLVDIVRKAAAAGEAVQLNIDVRDDTGHFQVDLRARRVDSPAQLKGLILVIFELAAPGGASVRGEGELAGPPGPEPIGELNERLEAASATYRAAIDRLQACNQQLAVENEELLAMNEQLNGANEELESTREEMHVLNEELQARRCEMQRKLDEMSLAADEILGLLDGTDVAVLSVDSQLRVKRYTARASRIFHLIPTDIGRPIADLASRLEYEHMLDDAGAVLRTLSRREVKVRDRDGAWYLARMVPCRTREGELSGLAITFLDVAKIETAPSMRPVTPRRAPEGASEPTGSPTDTNAS